MSQEEPVVTKEVVLIIEDNLFMSELLSEKVGRQGLDAIIVVDGEQALAKIDTERISLVLLDLPLSGNVDGFEVLAKIREKFGPTELPVITLFNLDDPQSMERSLALGANDYIVKAFASTDEITAKIADLIKNKTVRTNAQDVPSVTPATEGSELPKTPIRSFIHAPTIRKDMTLDVPEHVKARIEKALTQSVGEISIINLVDDLMEYSYLARTSDIHLEPVEDRLLARLRVDGIL